VYREGREPPRYPRRSSILQAVVRWERFNVDDYDISFHDAKLAAHGISRYDVMEILMNGFRVVRNKGAADRYRLLGRTDAGRALELVLVVESSRRLRFITGWDL
jgi:uncharacterized DUF497 family protein